MNRNILVVYKSVTGFTREYAERIAQEIDCAFMDLKETSPETMSNFDTVIFGGRMHAGTIDGLKSAKERFQQSKASHFIVYCTGATPNDTKEIIDEMWRNNLSCEELKEIPHFYMQSGLRFEKMPLPDKIMMKVFHFIIKKKKNKSAYEQQFEKAITRSYDISSRRYIEPLISYLNEKNDRYVSS